MNTITRLPALLTLLAFSGFGSSQATAQRGSGLGFALPETGQGEFIFGPEIGSTFRALVADQSTWQRWWTLHREEFLSLEREDRPTFSDPTELKERHVDHGNMDPLVIKASVLPALEALLADSEGSDELRATALLAAARLSSTVPSKDRQELVERQVRLEGYLLESLLSHSRSLHEAGIHGLGLVGSHRALSTLGDLALDNEAGRTLLHEGEVPLRSRSVAAYALGLASHRARRPSLRGYAVHQLEVLLDDEDSKHADLGTAIVLSLGLAPTTDMGGVDSSLPKPDLDELVQHLLERFGSSHTERVIVERIPTTLGRLTPAVSSDLQHKVVSTLASTLSKHSTQNNATRRSAALALGQIGDADNDKQDRDIRKALVGALDSRDALVRRYSAMSLARMGARRGNDERDPFAHSKTIAKQLQSNLHTGRQSDGPWNALALGVFAFQSNAEGQPTYATGDSLLKALRHSRSDDRAPALALATGLAGIQAARKPIEQHFAEISADEPRGWFALALGLLGDRQALPLLRKAATDSHYRPELRVDLALARVMLKDELLVPELLEQIEECDCWFSTLGSTRGLARVGDARALTPLLALASNEQRSDRERAEAAYALGWIVSGDTAPWSNPLTIALDPLGAPDTLTEPSGLGVLDRL